MNRTRQSRIPAIVSISQEASNSDNVGIRHGQARGRGGVWRNMQSTKGHSTDDLQMAADGTGAHSLCGPLVNFTFCASFAHHDSSFSLAGIASRFSWLHGKRRSGSAAMAGCQRYAGVCRGSEGARDEATAYRQKTNATTIRSLGMSAGAIRHDTFTSGPCAPEWRGFETTSV
jgi:hypothetical protein